MWHGYDCENQKNDFKSRRDYWIPKIERNIERDYEVTQKLIALDLLVMRFWDFEIRNNLQDCADKIQQAYNNRKEE